MKKLVDTVKNLDCILGKKKKLIQGSEKNGLVFSRRSLATNKHLSKNHKITANDIMFVRPRNKFSIIDEKKIIGKKVYKNMKFGELFQYKYLSKKL